MILENPVIVLLNVNMSRTFIILLILALISQIVKKYASPDCKSLFWWYSLEFGVVKKKKNK